MASLFRQQQKEGLMAEEIKHGPLGELWFYRDEFETDKYLSDHQDYAVLRPDGKKENFVLEIVDWRGAGLNESARRGVNAKYSISPTKLRRLIEEHGKKLEKK